MSRADLLRQSLLWVLGLLLCGCSCRAASVSETSVIGTATERPTAEIAATVIPGLPPNLTPTQGAHVPQAVKYLSMDDVPQLTGQTLGLGELRGLALSADGETLALAGKAGVAVYQVDTFELLRTVGDYTDPATSVALSSDGMMLASAHEGGTVILWDVATGSKLRSLERPIRWGWVHRMFFSPDGTRLVVSGEVGPVYQWNIAQEERPRFVDARFESEWYVLDSSPGHRTLVMHGYYDSAVLWDVPEDETVPRLDSSIDPYTAAISPDGTKLATALYDGTVLLWDMASGEQTHTLKRHGASGVVLGSLVFSPDGAILAGGAQYAQDREGEVYLWDTATGTRLPSLRAQSWSVVELAFLIDGETLLAGFRDGGVVTWDLPTGARLRSLGGHTGWVTGVAFSPDGATLASAAVNTFKLLDSKIALSVGAGDATLVQWDADTGRQVRTLADSSISAISAAFSLDGRRLAFGTGDGAVVVWDVVTGRSLFTSKGHYHTFRRVALSSDGSTLAAGTTDGAIVLWDVSAGRLLPTPKEGIGRMSRFALSPDGATLATGAPGRTIALWDTRTGERQRALELPEPQDTVWSGTAPAFSSDGRLLAVVSAGNLVLWNLTTDEREVRGITGFVYSLAFSSDARTLALGRRNGVALLDVATLDPVRRLTAPSEWLGKGNVAFSPDGTQVAAGARDHTVSLWHLDEETVR